MIGTADISVDHDLIAGSGRKALNCMPNGHGRDIPLHVVGMVRAQFRQTKLSPLWQKGNERAISIELIML